MASTPNPGGRTQFRTFGGPRNQLKIVGLRKSYFRDIFHFLMVEPWWVAFAVLAVVFAAVNGLFAAGFWWSGGIANAHPGSFEDAFFFSVQTLGTIGYGNMYPQSLAANVLVTLENLAGVIVVALATGIAYAKFSRSDAQIVFSRECAVCLLDGVPHLIFRVANQRGHLVSSARLHVSASRDYTTAEGMQIFRLLDLNLLRNYHPAFRRTWTVMHRIEGDSPLVGCTPESVMAEEMELLVALEGMDVTSSMTVTAHHSYLAHELVWGVRPADIWSELPDGRSQMDMRHFHRVVPMPPTQAFPFSGGKRVDLAEGVAAGG